MSLSIGKIYSGKVLFSAANSVYFALAEKKMGSLYRADIKHPDQSFSEGDRMDLVVSHAPARGTIWVDLPTEMDRLSAQAVELTIDNHNEGRSGTNYFLRISRMEGTLYVPEHFATRSLKRGRYGERVLAIITGKRVSGIGVPVACPEAFLPIAEDLLWAIGSGKVFIADQELDWDRYSVMEDNLRLFLRPTSPLRGSYFPRAIIEVSNQDQTEQSRLKELIRAGGLKFRLAIEGFDESWGIEDLVKAMASERYPLRAELVGVEKKEESLSIPRAYPAQYDGRSLGGDFFVDFDGEDEFYIVPKALAPDNHRKTKKKGEKLQALYTNVRCPHTNKVICCPEEFLRVAEILRERILDSWHCIAANENIVVADSSVRGVAEGERAILIQSLSPIQRTSYVFSGVLIIPEGQVSNTMNRITDEAFPFEVDRERSELSGDFSVWDLILRMAKGPLFLREEQG